MQTASCSASSCSIPAASTSRSAPPLESTMSRHMCPGCPDTSQRRGRGIRTLVGGKPPETVFETSAAQAVSSGFQRPQSATDRTGRGAQLQVEDKRESFVDGLPLVNSQPTSELAETVDVDCSKLLDEHACPLVGEVDLGSERSG